MDLHPKRDSENTSLKGMVSRAFGSRQKKPDDPAPNLNDVLKNLDVSEREAPTYPIHRIEFAETVAEQPVQPTPPVQPSQPVQPTRPSAGTPVELEAHRVRLEQLLESARQIEELLAKEAAQARALGENLELDEKRSVAAAAIEAEQKANAEVQAFTKNSETAGAYQAKVDAELVAARQELGGAEAAVNELQTRLRDAQNLVVLSKSKVIECESKSKEAAKRVELAKGLTNDAECRVAKCREARETADAEVHQAEEIASSIALTAEALKRIRNLGKN